MANDWSRRRFLITSALASGGLFVANGGRAASGQKAPAIVPSEKMRPQIPYGAAVGDISNNSAIIWSKCDRPATMLVDYSLQENFQTPRSAILQPVALETSDYTARVDLTGLPSGHTIFYRVQFQDLAYPGIFSAPTTGRFRTPATDGSVLLAWGGDTAGQGWGINPRWGGMKIYDTIRRLDPDFFIHSGDLVYADGVIKSEVTLPDGSRWENITTPEKSKVAETLAEFRGNYIYNLLDENVRRFNAQVPQLVQWDDHEVTNNWYPGEMLLGDDRYTVKSANLLAARGRRAFLEYTPMRWNAIDPERIYRSFRYGPNLDIFMLDMRSYRGPNSPNRQPTASTETAFLGSEQIRWLKQQLQASRATWKIIASDMPLGLIVTDGQNFENLANGDGVPLGRELELADLLQFIQQSNIQNVVWLTADVHYAAAHYYNPANAQFTNFKPFWEFVAGPLNSGTYGSSKLDNTFGPEVRFNSLAGRQPTNNLPPSAGLQFFGTVNIDGTSKSMTVLLRNLEGKVLYQITLMPES